jgi:hypothetical protein
MDKDFTQQMIRWKHQVSTDPKVPKLALRISFLLAERYVDREAGEARVQQSELAVLLGASIRGVQKAIDAAVELGHLERRVSKRLGNSYRPIVKHHGEPSGEGPNTNSSSYLESARYELPFVSDTNGRSSQMRTGVRNLSLKKNKKEGGGGQTIGHPLPQDWKPSEQDVAFAVRDGLAAAEIPREVGRFCDFCRSKGRRSMDWAAEWRNWVRRTVEWRRTADQEAELRRKASGGGRAGRPFI